MPFGYDHFVVNCSLIVEAVFALCVLGHSCDAPCFPEEEGAGEEEEQPESAERKEQNTDGQTGQQNVQSDTAVELAGEASERDQAKQVSAPPAQHSTFLPFALGIILGGGKRVFYHQKTMYNFGQVWAHEKCHLKDWVWI